MASTITELYAELGFNDDTCGRELKVIRREFKDFTFETYDRQALLPFLDEKSLATKNLALQFCDQERTSRLWPDSVNKTSLSWTSNKAR